MNGVLVAVAAFAACGMELAEAALVVLVVVHRGQRRAALVGAAAGGLVVVVAALLLGPATIALVPLDVLRLLLGGGLLLLGAFWLGQAVLRPGAAAAELAHEEAGAHRWARRGALGSGLVSAKAVGVESAEAVVILVAIGAPGHRVGWAVGGALLAAAVVTGLSARLAHRLSRLAAGTVTPVAGAVLVAVGSFWLAEGAKLPIVGTAVLVVAVTAVAVGVGLLGLSRVQRLQQDRRVLVN